MPLLVRGAVSWQTGQDKGLKGGGDGQPRPCCATGRGIGYRPSCPVPWPGVLAAARPAYGVMTMNTASVRLDVFASLARMDSDANDGPTEARPA